MRQAPIKEPDAPAIVATQLGTTATGPLYRVQTTAWLAPPREAFAYLQKLGHTAASEAPTLNADGKAPENSAVDEHAIATGTAIGSFIGSSFRAQRWLFEVLTLHILESGDATGLETLYLTAWQTIAWRLEPAAQTRATDMWNGIVRSGKVATTHGVTVVDRLTDTIATFSSEQLTKAGPLNVRSAVGWYPLVRTRTRESRRRQGRGMFGSFAEQTDDFPWSDAGVFGDDPWIGDLGNGPLDSYGMTPFGGGIPGSDSDTFGGYGLGAFGGVDTPTDRFGDYGLGSFGDGGLSQMGPSGGPFGPLSGLQNQIDSVMDREGDAHRAKAEADRDIVNAQALQARSLVIVAVGMGIATGGAGLAVSKAFGESTTAGLIAVGVGAFVAGFGIGAAYAASKNLEDATERKRAAEVEIANAQEEARKKAAEQANKKEESGQKGDGKRPPDDVAGGGPGPIGPHAIPVAVTVLTGEGLRSLFVQTKKGHLRMMGLASHVGRNGASRSALARLL